MAELRNNDSSANEEEPARGRPLTVYTIGHSTRTIEEFIGILQTYAIQQVVDVRRIPRSRTNPQFNEEAICRSLAEVHLRYHHLKALGGLRHTRPDSPNTGWRNASFRGYADYMLTPVFHEAFQQLIDLASTACTVIMCAEAVPWRCHRSLVADALMAHGVRVYDLFSRTSCKPHALPAMAHIHGDDIYYQEEA